METAKLKKFAQAARRSLMDQVSAKLKLVVADNSPARREKPQAIGKLERAIKNHGKAQVIERVAYTWFNRFCALRFMDVNRYTRIGVVSPSEGQFQPEILAEAKMGHIDEEMVHDKVRQQIFALLDGKAPSRDPQGEAYRLLVVAACNFWNKAMPFLFQRIDDYTELLMPDDLLSGNSILAHTREAMTPDVCGVGSEKWEVGSEEKTSHSPLSTSHSAAAGGVEVIGWLYQFYNSEKKDEVFDGLKKNQKITPENIPAATQLFTPHWIVRYLLENSLGRLWLLNRPGSKLIEQMDYYIKPADSESGAETDFLRIAKPEEIKICDLACGSGHMLTYAFDLLYAIYEEEGYEPAEIPEKILTHNLYGIEIDERAGELAAFALTMKARAKQRRFFNKGVKPNICVLENVHFDEGELKDYMDFVGRDLFTAPLQTTLRQFEEADNFGSLIRPDVTDVGSILSRLEAKDISGQLFLSETHKKVLQALRQADFLSPKYHVVIANPPYMGGKGMNGRLGAWLKDNFPKSKADLMTCFMERASTITLEHGIWGMINLPSWMFLSSFEKMRSSLLKNSIICSLLHLGRGIFGSDFGSVAFVIQNKKPVKASSGIYRRLFEKHVQVRSAEEIRNLFLDSKYNRFVTNQTSFQRIPGQPIAYWASHRVFTIFMEASSLGDRAEVKHRLSTGKNDAVVRFWPEVSWLDFGRDFGTKDEALQSGNKWFPYNKGGEFRRWYGNCEFVLRYDEFGNKLMETFSGHRHDGKSHYFHEGVTWTFVTSGNFAARYTPRGFVFDVGGSSLFPDNAVITTAFLCSSLSFFFLKMLNPTLNFQVGNLKSLPLMYDAIKPLAGMIEEKADQILSKYKLDWDAYETSWDFSSLPIVNPDYRQPTLKATYQKLRAHWREMTLEMQRLEQENNRIFIDAYGLQDELTPEVPLNEITLTCNPHYRYGVEECEVGSEKWEEMESRLLHDTMKELVSYAVGCMFGRYSLNIPGLVLANQGEGIEEYYKKIEEYRANEREKLSGTDRLAEGHGSSRDDLPGHSAIPEGGALRFDESDPQGSSLNSLEHSGRSGKAINSGVQKLSVDSTGFQSGSRNSAHDCSTTGLSTSAESRSDPESLRGDQTHDLRSNSEAVLTSHSPLPTSHLSFVPDEDNVIPMLDGDWFTDDIAERFRKFLRAAFGEEHYEENLRFVEQALNLKGKRNYSIRDYFLGEFYTDHVKRYKKRPIYWLFSSPKGSFNALIYLHRYRPDTVSVVLNDYLREFRAKLTAHKNHLEALSISASASQGERTKALKEIDRISKMITEMEEYEREILYPLATQQVAIDLDDGVKVNYPKFGTALKKIVGLDAKED